MFTFLVLLFLLICLFMVLVILMQSSKGGGLASSFGGAGGGSSFLGARGTANFLQKATMFLGISYGVITLLIGVYVSASNTAGQGQSEAEQLFEQQKQEMTLPMPAFDPQEAQMIDEAQSQSTETEEAGTQETDKQE